MRSLQLKKYSITCLLTVNFYSKKELNKNIIFKKADRWVKNLPKHAYVGLKNRYNNVVVKVDIAQD
jgi:hypothetical protein